MALRKRIFQIASYARSMKILGLPRVGQFPVRSPKLHFIVFYAIIIHMTEILSYLENIQDQAPLDIAWQNVAQVGLVESVVVIPVAVHQEDVGRLVDVYRQQIAGANWRLYLYLNAPDTHMRHPNVSHNLSLLQNMSSTVGEFGEIKWGAKAYEWDGRDGQFSMGKVRKDAWYHALTDVAKTGLSDTTLGFSQDADTLDVSPGFINSALISQSERPTHFILPHTYWGVDGP